MLVEHLALVWLAAPRAPAIQNDCVLPWHYGPLVNQHLQQGAVVNHKANVLATSFVLQVGILDARAEREAQAGHANPSDRTWPSCMATEEVSFHGQSKMFQGGLASRSVDGHVHHVFIWLALVALALIVISLVIDVELALVVLRLVIDVALALVVLELALIVLGLALVVLGLIVVEPSLLVVLGLVVWPLRRLVRLWPRLNNQLLWPLWPSLSLTGAVWPALTAPAPTPGFWPCVAAGGTTGPSPRAGS